MASSKSMMLTPTSRSSRSRVAPGASVVYCSTRRGRSCSLEVRMARRGCGAPRLERSCTPTRMAMLQRYAPWHAWEERARRAGPTVTPIRSASATGQTLGRVVRPDPLRLTCLRRCPASLSRRRATSSSQPPSTTLGVCGTSLAHHRHPSFAFATPPPPRAQVGTSVHRSIPTGSS